MGKLINIDDEYKEWLQDVSRRFKRSQIKAAIKVNDEMLRFCPKLGQNQAAEKIVHNLGAIWESFITFHGGTIKLS